MSRIDSAGLAKQAGSGAGGLGTMQTVMEYFVPVETASDGTATEEMTVEETVGHPFPTDSDRGVQYFAPTMAGRVRSSSLPRLLSGFMGAPLTTTPGGGTTSRNHNFDPVARPTPIAHSILLSRIDTTPDIVDLFWDAIGQELGLNVGMNEWLGFDASYVAKEINEAQPAPTVTADLSRRSPFYECKVYLSVGGGAEAEIAVSSFGLTYGLNVPTDVGKLGSRRLWRIVPGNRTADLTFTPKDETPSDILSYYRRARALTPTNIKVRLEALGPIIESTIAHKIEIIVHRAFEIEAPADVSAADVLTEVAVSARPSYSSAASKFIEVNVVNTVATY